MTIRRHVSLFAVLMLSAAVAGCGTGMGALPESGPSGPGVSGSPQVPPLSPQAPVSLPAMTADGTQQFVVPAGGRAVLRNKLTEQVQGPIQSAQVSNGWRTAAGAQANPNDYAACVQAVTTTGQTRYLLMIVRGNSISGYETGGQAAQKCQDGRRVVQWAPFSEAMSG